MDTNQLLARKHEIVKTTNSIGWKLLTGLGEDIVRQMERDAIDEEDDNKGTQLRREAKAARKFLNTFLTAVDTSCSLDLDTSPDDAFMTI